MHCNGKCHLMKELAKAAETEKPISPDKKHLNIETLDWFFNEPLEYSFLLTLNNQGTSHFQYNNLYAHLSVQGIFHPPTFCA